MSADPDVGLFASLLTELPRGISPTQQARILARDGDALVALRQALTPLMAMLEMQVLAAARPSLDE